MTRYYLTVVDRAKGTSITDELVSKDIAIQLSVKWQAAGYTTILSKRTREIKNVQDAAHQNMLTYLKATKQAA